MTDVGSLRFIPAPSGYSRTLVYGTEMYYGTPVKNRSLAKVKSVALLCLMILFPVLFCFQGIRDKRKALWWGFDKMMRGTRITKENMDSERVARAALSHAAPRASQDMVKQIARAKKENYPEHMMPVSGTPLSYEDRRAVLIASAEIFQALERGGNLQKLGSIHFDWGTFPSDIDRSSHGKGWAFSWTREEIERAKADPELIAKFRESVRIAFKAIGWDVCHDVSIPSLAIKFTQVRLGKILLACHNLGQMDLFENGLKHVKMIVEDVTDGALKAAYRLSSS